MSITVREQTSAELAVFARLLRAHAALRRRLEARLLAEHGLTINDFETLLHLAHEPEGRLRRVDLAERLLLTPSGVTRLLEGLHDCGLVEKGTCATDARVTYAVLTDAGRRRAEEASVAHAEAVRELLGSRLDDAELATLDELLARLPGGAEADPAECLVGDGA
jgi:DNA-binding MarR family transcriptional regulator